MRTRPEVGCPGGGRCANLRRTSLRQQSPAKLHRLASSPIRKEPEVADAHKSRRQHMEEESPQELLDTQRHQALFVLVRRVAPSKTDLAFCEADQPVVRDRDAVRVSAEI